MSSGDIHNVYILQLASITMYKPISRMAYAELFWCLENHICEGCAHSLLNTSLSIYEITEKSLLPNLVT